MREMLLLGAGASAQAGIPTSYDLTSKILELVDEEEYKQVLSMAMWGQLFHPASAGVDPTSYKVDVEAVFRAVQLLADRHMLEISPFISGWHKMIDEIDRRSARSGEVVQTLGNVIATRGGPFASYMAERSLSDFVALHLPRSGGGDIFRRTNEVMIRVLREIVWLKDQHTIDYLSPIVRILNHQEGVVVATLNYDNSIELMASTYDVECVTGIEQWSIYGDFYCDSEGISLLKLHGSIDWGLVPNQSSPERPMPHSAILQRSAEEMERRDRLRDEMLALLDSEWPDSDELHRVAEELDEDDPYQPSLIFGQGSKLTAEGPYLDLLQAFRRELSRTDFLTVIGYSFRDPHVNEYITQWINENTSREMRIVNGVDYAIKATGYGERLLNSLGERVMVVPERAAEALLELWPAESDQD